MKSLVIPALLLAHAAASETIERLDPALDRILAPGTVVETLCTGFDWTEGPVWDPAENRLLFSDIPPNTVYQWKEGDTEASVFMKPSGFTGVGKYSAEPGSNGIALDAEGRLLFCEHGDRRVSVLTKNGGKRTLADNYDGKRFNSPNDLAVHSSGAIYFTDPIYGLPERENDPSRELDFCGVFRIAPDGIVTLLTKELDRPNGIAFSPDEKTLYVAQSHGPLPVIMAYPVKEDGTLDEGKIFFNTRGLEGRGAPDGLKVAADGTLFATGPGGLLILTPDAKLLGRVLCGRPTANVAFGGNFLYLTSDDRILRIPVAEGFVLKAE